MEERRMPSNSYPPDPINSQTTDYIPPLADLPQKPKIPQTPAVKENAARADTGDDAEAQQQESGQTLAFVIGKVNDFLQWFAITLEIILLLRFIFMLIGADPSNVFASFLYALTTVILVPFSGIVRNPSLHTNQAFEWTTLIGMAIYALIFWLLRWLVNITITPPKPVE
jgi:hypothetical protein